MSTSDDWEQMLRDALAAGDQETERFIGLPEGETGTYTFGHLRRPGNWKPEQVEDLQQKLALAGLLPGRYRNRVFDGPTQQAYEALLSMANVTGKTATQTLTDLMSAPQVGGAGEQAPTPPHPDDLRVIARQSVRSSLGRDPLPDEEERFIKAYNATFSSAISGGTDLPNPQAQAELFVGREMGQERANFRGVEQLDAFRQMLDGA